MIVQLDMNNARNNAKKLLLCHVCPSAKHSFNRKW